VPRESKSLRRILKHALRHRRDAVQSKKPGNANIEFALKRCALMAPDLLIAEQAGQKKNSFGHVASLGAISFLVIPCAPRHAVTLR